MHMFELVNESTMVTNVELAKEVIEKKERNRLLEEALEVMESRFDKFAETIDKVKEKIGVDENKGKVVDVDDIIPKLDPPLQEEPFLKAMKAFDGKAL